VPTLEKQGYLLDARFGVADAYLFTVLGWMGSFAIDLKQWPVLAAYIERVGARPSVKAALAAEAVISAT
jgi:glutathione S-transferase